jgi:hypothetical protein
MIRLQSLLESNMEPKPRVLFIGDSELKTSYNFAKNLMSSKRIDRNSKIKFKSRADLETLLNILEDNSESHYDLIVLFFNNLQDLKLNQVIDKLNLAISIAHKYNSKIVLFTLPTLLHLTGKKIPNKKEKYIHHNINNWIRNNSNADFIIDIESNIDDAAYYESNSTTLNSEGHLSIFKQLNRIITGININPDIDDTKRKLSTDLSKLTKKDIKQLHQTLTTAGYDIDKTELIDVAIGATTIIAIRKYNIDNQQSALIDPALNQISDVPSNIALDGWNQLKNIVGKLDKIQYTKGENADAMNVMRFLIDKGLSVAGAAGIAGNMKIESNFKTAILGDNGTSIGLCQWHFERKDKLFSWAKQNGYDPVSTNGQLEYLWWELGTLFSKLKSDLKIIQDPQGAAYQFAKEFERPKNISTNRSVYAQQYFNEYTSVISNNQSIVNKADAFTGTKTIVIGDSITPHLAKIAGFSPGPKARGTGDYSGTGLWFGGIGLSSLQNMAAAYKTVHLDVKNVVITIGTNGYGSTGGVGGLATNLKRIFPNAKLFVCQGAYGPGWKSTKYPHLANYTDKYMSNFYNAFAAAGITVVPYPIKDTVTELHTPTVPVYKKWGSYINSAG